jgi:Rrf2 family protein
MLSQRAHYALRAVLIIAAYGAEAPMRTPQIAKAARVSSRFLEQVLLELRKAGILQSFRGRTGGFILGRPAREISFADIVKVTDGSLALSPCVCEVAYARCSDCFDESFCEIRRALGSANDLTVAVLKSYDVEGAARRMQAAGKL